MMEPLHKFARMMRRDHLNAVAVGACAFWVGLAGVIGFAAGTPLLWAAAGLIFSGVLAASFVVCDELKMRRTKNIDLGFRVQDGIGYFQHLTGPARKVAIIMNTQRLVENMTKKYRNLAAVPRKELDWLQPFFLDAQEAARDVKAVVPETPIELPKFEFTRKTFDKAAGTKGEQVVASISLPHTLAPWEIARREREEQQRQRETLAAEIAAMTEGTARKMTVRALRFKPKSGLSQ
jgi:hypothetical protein